MLYLLFNFIYQTIEAHHMKTKTNRFTASRKKVSYVYTACLEYKYFSNTLFE
jgi:hypothetical protein